MGKTQQISNRHDEDSVCSIRGDPIPGPRYLSGFHTSPFPWPENIDVFEDVTSVNAFNASIQLSRHGLISGPSSGQALCGLVAHLQAAKAEGRLGDYVDAATGEVNAVFVCADLPYQYMDLYFKVLPKHAFPPTFNEVCHQLYALLTLPRVSPSSASLGWGSGITADKAPFWSRICSLATLIPTTSGTSCLHRTDRSWQGVR